jgi:antitoxin component of MazEF toxin-antitoxin module
MNTGKIIKVGNSLALVVPKAHARQLGWLPGDVVAQEISGDKLILQNVTRPKIRFIQTVREYGNGRVERS